MKGRKRVKVGKWREGEWKGTDGLGEREGENKGRDVMAWVKGRERIKVRKWKGGEGRS